MPRNRDNSFCCGAGGGRIWIPDTPGQERPSENRIREAVGLPDVELFVVACPKDVTMYEDAIKTSGNADRIELRELTELIEEALVHDIELVTRLMRRPSLIGVSASLHDFGDYGGVGIQRPLLEAGGVPVTLPQMPDAIGAALEHVSAIAARARPRHRPRLATATSRIRCCAPTEPRRDEFEFALVPAAIERELPLLGICRGMQVLNVARGGTLVQDVRLAERSREHPSDPGWKSWKQMEVASLDGGEIPAHPRHEISIARPSILHSALGSHNGRPSTPSTTRRLTASGRACGPPRPRPTG